MDVTDVQLLSLIVNLVTGLNMIFKVLVSLWTVRINLESSTPFWDKFFCLSIYIFFAHYTLFLGWSIYVQIMIWTVDENCYEYINGQKLDIEGCLDYFEGEDVIMHLWLAWLCQWILVLPLSIGLLGGLLCCPIKLSDVPKEGGEKRRED